MAPTSVSLDTNALMLLAGADETVSRKLKTLIETSNLRLSITHVQVDEIANGVSFRGDIEKAHAKKVSHYQQKINIALESLEKKGIAIQVEPTEIIVTGIWRLGFGKISSEELGNIYDELRDEIRKCEEAKGRTKPLLNIARDAVIAVSSMRHDFFVTTDSCLYDSLCQVIEKHKTEQEKLKFPKVFYCRRSIADVTNCILSLFTNTS
jgi:predicted nucleic acid-binding protein